ncbi:translation initiation factor IF-2-like [Prionailurus viverrinus]|uniref:translation initiation factor IF-2-like n=1 Tax=Prionailurus viverrinus TaxID=61388 RepID=UPI001FF5CAB7|nr:translation initiation factor IF-2-like [Prionailurus viverrinus]
MDLSPEGRKGRGERDRSGARKRPPFLEPRGRRQGPQRGASANFGTPAAGAAASLRWSPRAHQPHSPAAPSSAPALRPAPLAAHPPVARTPVKRPAPAQSVAAPRKKALSPPSAPQLPAVRSRPEPAQTTAACSRRPRAPAAPPPALVAPGFAGFR